MDPKHTAIFDQALGIEDPGQRAEFLKQSCAGNVDLLAMFDALMAEETTAKSACAAAEDASLPTHIGPYRIVERIGSGGMGEVFRAEQRAPIRREVAIKLIKLGMDTKQVVARFEAERQAMALMDHPNIAKVYGADADENGRPYFAMEYVKGIPITEFADRNHLSVRERLELFQQVCRAIQHAHQKGVIHRDIKPGNILVSIADGQHRAKVIDFGIAKATAQQLTDKTLHTLLDQFIGTPQYMSPEQAGGGLDIDTRTDVYSLGVLLYELLTGQTPFDQSKLRRAALHEIARVLSEDEPPKPSTRLGSLGVTGKAKTVPLEPGDASVVLDTVAKARSAEGPQLIKEVKGELDWLVMKSIEKDRARRYDSPGALADDISRYLDGSPILAAPPTFRYRAGKFVNRYRLPVSLALGSAALLVACVVVVSGMAIRLSEQVKLSERSRIEAEKAKVSAEAARNAEGAQRAEAEQQRRTAEHASARNRAMYLKEQNLLAEALAAAKEAYRLDGSWEDSILLEQITGACRSTWELQHHLPAVPKSSSAAFVDGIRERFLMIGKSQTLERHSLATGRLEKAVESDKPIRWIKSFRGRADRLIVGAMNHIEVRGIEDLKVLARKEFGELDVVEVAAGIDRIAVTLSNDVTQVYTSGLELVAEKPWPPNARRKRGNQLLKKLAISPSGKFVISSGATHTNDSLIWNVEKDTHWLQILPVNFIQFVTESQILGATHFVNSYGVSLWRMDLSSGENSVSAVQCGEIPFEDLGFIQQIEASRSHLVCVGQIGVARVVFGRSGHMANSSVSRYTSLAGETADKPSPCVVSLYGAELAVCSPSGISLFSNTMWGEIDGLNKGRNLVLGRTSVYHVDRLPESLILSSITLDEKEITTRMVLPAPAVETPGMNSIACGVAVSHDEKVLAVRFTEAERMLAAGERVTNHSVVVYRGWNDGLDSASVRTPVVIRLADQGRSAESAARDSGRLFELSEDGRFLLVGTREERLSLAELYDTESGTLLKRWIEGDDFGDQLVAIPGTGWFADLSSDRKSVRLRDWKSGEIRRQIKIGGIARSLCAGPDGQSLIVGVGKRRIERYDIQTGGLTGAFNSIVVPVAFSPHGDVFLGILADSGESGQGSLVLADAITGNVKLVLEKSYGPGDYVAFARDGEGFGFGTWEGEWLFMGRMTPEMADRRLSRLHGAYVVHDPYQWQSKSAEALALPKSASPSVEVRSFSAAYHAATDFIDASDIGMLKKNLKQKAKVKGRVVKVETTRSKTGVNVFLNSVESGPMLWVNIGMVKNAKVPHFYSLVNKEITIQGTIGTYGGLRPELKDRLQIDLASMADIALLQPATTSDPGSPEE